jgi:hypothetical protein
MQKSGDCDYFVWADNMSATKKLLMERFEELEKRLNAFNDGVDELVERKCKHHCDVIWRELGSGQKNFTLSRAMALLTIFEWPNMSNTVED